MKKMKKSCKSSLLPKDIVQKRIAKSSIMKINTSELNLNCKENIQPQIPFVSKFNLKIHDRETEKIGRENPFDIPNRLRVFTKSKGLRKEKPIPFIMSEPHTICDVDSTFYNIIEGRPLRQFDDIKVYVRNIRDITLMRASAAYLKDQIIQINTSFTEELKNYENIDKLFVSCKNNFVQFAKESYNDAKAIQKKASDKERELDQMTNNLEALCFEYVALRNRVGVLMVNFEILSRYRNFLNTISPETWRTENDQKHISFSYDFDEVSSSDELMREFTQRIQLLTEMPLKLYFKKPKTLMSIFDNLCHLCLTYMGINVFMSNVVTPVVKGKNSLKKQVTDDINEMHELIETYKGFIKYAEEKEKATKLKFEKILINDFQTLYASYDSSKLFTCLQYTNTEVFQGPADPKDSMTSLMLQLERYYFELSSALDNLNQDVVKKATNEYFTEDIKMMRRAHKAQRYLKECNILSKALFASFEPPRLTKNFQRK